MTNEADALVIVGATGDIACRRLFPALHALIRRGQTAVPVIGVAPTAIDLSGLRARAYASVKEHSRVDARAFAALSAQLQYVCGEYGDPDTFRRLRRSLGAAYRPLYY